MLKKDNKKAHISEALAGGEIQALQSANADQHRDRITRFASLKHRAKKQEKYLWTLFTPGNPSDESQLAVKSAQKLSECGNYLLFKNYFTVYPNPSDNILNISKNDNILINNIAIYNVLGQLVISIPNAESVQNIDVSKLSEGQYFIVIKTEKGISNTKFIKN